MLEKIVMLMTLINPDPIATIRFECEVCGRGLYPHRTISDGCSDDPDDWEGKPTTEMLCPVHGWSYKRECYNCAAEYGCEIKKDRPKRRGAGVKVTWFKDAPNDEQTPPPCKFWSPRGAFYTEPTCWYCRFKVDASEDLGNGAIRMHGRFCSSEASPCYGKLLPFDAPACDAWKSRYTIHDKMKHYRERARNLASMLWNKFTGAVRPFRVLRYRIKELSRYDIDGDCDWCKFYSITSFECKNENSTYYGSEGWGDCNSWKHRQSRWQRAWHAIVYVFTGKD